MKALGMDIVDELAPWLVNDIVTIDFDEFLAMMTARKQVTIRIHAHIRQFLKIGAALRSFLRRVRTPVRT